MRFYVRDNIGLAEYRIKEVIGDHTQLGEGLQRYQKGMDLGLLTIRLFLKLVDETLQIEKDTGGKIHLFFDFPVSYNT